MSKINWEDASVGDEIYLEDAYHFQAKVKILEKNVDYEDDFDIGEYYEYKFEVLEAFTGCEVGQVRTFGSRVKNGIQTYLSKNNFFDKKEFAYSRIPM